MYDTRLEMYRQVPIPSAERLNRFWKTGEIDKALYEDTLKNKMIGRDFYGATSKFAPWHLFCHMIEASPILSKYRHEIHIDSDTPQHGVIEYMNRPLFSFEIKKKKKACRMFLGDYRFVWVIKDVILYNFPSDLLGRFEEIDRLVIEEKEQKITEEEKLFAFFKEIAALRPEKDLYRLFEDLKKIYDRRYSFPGRLKDRKENP